MNVIVRTVFAESAITEQSQSHIVFGRSLMSSRTAQISSALYGILLTAIALASQFAPGLLTAFAPIPLIAPLPGMFLLLTFLTAKPVTKLDFQRQTYEVSKTPSLLPYRRAGHLSEIITIRVESESQNLWRVVLVLPAPPQTSRHTSQNPILAYSTDQDNATAFARRLAYDIGAPFNYAELIVSKKQP